MKHKIALVIAMPVLLTLAACGGGGGGTVASTPPPVPAPSPAPSPTPSPSPSPAPPDASTRAPVSGVVTPVETFEAVGVVATSDNFVLQPGSITVGRDGSGGYVITLPVVTALPNSTSLQTRTISFSASTLVSSSDGTLRFRGLQSADSTTESFDNELVIALPQAAGNRLRYINFAQLAVCNSVSGGSCPAPASGRVDDLLVFGRLTPAGEIPLIGSASYSGEFTMTRYYQSEPPTLKGAIGLLLNFGTGVVSGTLRNVRMEQSFYIGDGEGTTEVENLPDFALTGSLTGGGYLSGSIAPPSGTMFTGGRWNGALFGPGVAELGGTILLEQPTAAGGPFVGTFGAVKQ